MISFSVLASGSKGNASVIEAFGYRILIDCGISYKDLSARLQFCGLTPADLDAVFITHYHSDHIKGIPTLLNKMPLEVFARKGFEGLYLSNTHYIFQHTQKIEVGPFSVEPFSLPHDGGGSLGFFMSCGTQSLLYATDLGVPTDELEGYLPQADAIIIESNHDLELLKYSPYPEFVKIRNRSDHGHLSNCQSSAVIARNITQRCQCVVLAHISEKANTPELALKNMIQAVEVPVFAASQKMPMQWFRLSQLNQAEPQDGLIVNY